MVNLEICYGKLQMKVSLDETKRTYQTCPLSTPTGVALGIPTTTVPAARMISSTTQVGVHTFYSSSICIFHSSAPSTDIPTHYLVYLPYPLLLPWTLSSTLSPLVYELTSLATSQTSQTCAGSMYLNSHLVALFIALLKAYCKLFILTWLHSCV